MVWSRQDELFAMTHETGDWAFVRGGGAACQGACMVLAVSRKFMTRLLCAECKEMHVQCNVMCERVAASNSHGVCRV